MDLQKDIILTKKKLVSCLKTLEILFLKISKCENANLEIESFFLDLNTIQFLLRSIFVKINTESPFIEFSE